MSTLNDWINALSNPADDLPIAKEIKRWNEINESINHGDYIPGLNFEDSPLAHIENTVKVINEKLEIEHKLHIEDRKDADRQKIIERNRFIITTIIGVVAAIAAIVGTTVSIITYLS